MHDWTGRTAFVLVERARAAGWRDGAILDELDVTEPTPRSWRDNPKTVPHRSTAERLSRFAAKLDRAAKRKAAQR